MRQWSLFTFILVFSLPSFVDGALIADPVTQHDIMPIKYPAAEQVFYGELTTHAHTFEFVVPEDMTLRAEVSFPKDSKYKKSLVVVREEKRGVSEVGRVSYNDDNWQKKTDWLLGRKFLTQGALEVDISPGVYRAEVSSPENLGKYKFTIGTEPERRGYSKMLSDAALGSNFFGKTPLAIVRTPIVLVSVLILVLFIYMVRRYKRREHA